MGSPQAMPETPIVFITPESPDRYPDLGPFYVDENCHFLQEVDILNFDLLPGKSCWGRIRSELEI